MLQRIRQSRLYLYAIVVLMVVLAAGQLVQAGDFAPGSQQDPLVTQSYVEQRNEQLKFYFEQKLQEFDSLIQQMGDRITALQSGSGGVQPESTAAAVLEVVNVPAGKTLTGYAGTEIVLRGGKATAVQSQLGGLADLTGARDIGQGQIIPDNHLLLIPRTDGRGVKAETDCIFMVKGRYDIQ
ncbi:MAG: hypothetical protein WCS98_06380 [Bacillota bacterium]|nr:hypothetical protein [Bacillota bacterium]MDD3298383.1 hypothetical protein [Bacillota bacterium]MDD3850692.1 hypothetical protein [Bacillota bacterium]MDD4707917.1 hypothetical protein [Bacillota bacterium]